MPNILESLAESQINGEKDKPRETYIGNEGADMLHREKLAGNQHQLIP